MQFSELIYGAEILSTSGDAGVSGLQYDSRKIKKGDAFFAMKGEVTDGNEYIDKAIANGAVAVLTDSPKQKQRDGIAWAVTHPGHGRRALAVASANFYGKPAEKLSLIGVTGTNGKTTTTFLVERMLEVAGKKSALIGTIEYRIAGRVIPAPHTTPESLELNQFFADAVKQGATEGVMEVSSHALAQERVWAVPYDVAVFTNLTRDHLDYHSDMDDYYRAKRRLFEGVGTEPPRVAVINQDDEYGKRLINDCKGKVPRIFTYGRKSGSFHAEFLEITSRGSKFELVTPGGAIRVFTHLVGEVNVYNVLAASAAAYARGCTLAQIAEAVNSMSHVPGRFQRVDNGQPFTVVVDYAHTDDALRNLTSVARSFVESAGVKGKVITMFGCGGDRDKKKRPMMGRAAGEGSDFVVLTSDNPRSEDPLAIIHDALAGLRGTGKDFTIEPDRKRAINVAVRLARPGDIVLLAGKGHEKVQISKGKEQPFDDVEIAKQALYAAGFTEDFDRAMAQPMRQTR